MPDCANERVSTSLALSGRRIGSLTCSSNGESHAHFANTNFQPEIWEPGAEYKLREKEKERTPQSRRAS